MPVSYYKYSYQNTINFFIIDTETFNKKQQEWLIKSLDNSTGHWQIILEHRPIRTFEIEKYQENWMGKTELKDILCNYADIYVAGHSHVLEYVGKINDNCKNIQLISGRGEAIPRKVLQSNNDEFYFEGNGFISFYLKDYSLTLLFLNDEGEIIYTKNFWK